MVAGFNPLSRGFNPDQFNIIIQERVKHANCIRSSAYTSDDGIREPPLFFENLLLCLLTDYRLEVPYYGRVRMGPTTEPIR